MADKKKLGDYIEIRLPAYGGRAVLRRQEESDEDWAAVKERVVRAGLDFVEDSGKPPSGDRVKDLTNKEKLFEFSLQDNQQKPPEGPPPERGPVEVDSLPPLEQRPDWATHPKNPANAATTKQEPQPVEGSAEAPPQVEQYEQTPPERIRASTSDLVGPFDHLKTPSAAEPDSGGPPTPAMAAPQAEQPGALQQVAEGVARNLGLGGAVDVVKGISNNVIGPNRGPADVLREAGASLAGGPRTPEPMFKAPESTQPPTQPPTQPQQPQQPAGAGVSSSVGVRVPGSGGGSQLEADANRAFADQAEALRERAELERQQARDAAALENEKQQYLIQADEARAARAKALVAEQERVVQAQREISSKLEESLKVDPRRLWNSRTAEQKANAQLAGFLFGLGGQGLQFVQQLQSEVDKDIAIQVQEFQSRRSGLEKQLDAQNNLFAQYRQMGLDANQAATAAKDSILAVYQSKLKQLEFDYQGKSAGARAAEAAGAIGVQRVELQNKLKNDASVRAERAAMSALRQQEMSLKANAPAKPKQMNATLLKRIADRRGALTKIQEMKRLAANKGFTERLGNKVLSTGLDSREQAKTRSFDSLRFQLSTDIANSALQKQEQEFLLPLLGERTQLLGDPVATLDEAERNLRANLQSDLQTLELYGSGVEGAQDPLAQDQVNFQPE